MNTLYLFYNYCTSSCYQVEFERTPCTKFTTVSISEIVVTRLSLKRHPVQDLQHFQFLKQLLSGSL